MKMKNSRKELIKTELLEKLIQQNKIQQNDKPIIAKIINRYSKSKFNHRLGSNNNNNNNKIKYNNNKIKYNNNNKIKHK